MKSVLLGLGFLLSCLAVRGQVASLGPETTRPKPPLHITLVVWDFDGLDGDSIALTINGKQLGPEAIRLWMYKPGLPDNTFRLELPDDDKNELSITSLGQGSVLYTTMGLLIADGAVSQRSYYVLRKGQKIRLKFVSRK